MVIENASLPLLVVVMMRRMMVGRKREERDQVGVEEDVDLPQMHSALLPQQVEGLDAIAVVVVVFVVLDCRWEGESGSEARETLWNA
jgi:hypothetical protein